MTRQTEEEKKARQQSERMAYAHVYRQAHREEAKAYSRIYYLAHQEEAKASSRANRQAHPNEAKAQHQAYYLAHRQDEAARTRVGQRKYRQAHPEKNAAQLRKRRALKRGVPHQPYKTADIIERDRSICGLCGKKVDKAEQTIDHILPLSLGGADAPHNVQLAHRRCNSGKKNSARYPANLRLALD